MTSAPQMALEQIRETVIGYYSEYAPSSQHVRDKFPRMRPEVVCAIFGFVLGMCMSLGPLETLDVGVFMLSQAATTSGLVVNWVIEPKYTGQEDLPPGFRGEAPSLDARAKDESQPQHCQTVDPSALVCSTVRLSGFSLFLRDFVAEQKNKEQLGISTPVFHTERTQPIFIRQAFDEIQGRAPFVSEDDKFIAFWCEKAAAWRLTVMANEQEVRNGSCAAYAASSDGVQFKDAMGWVEADEIKEQFLDPEQLSGQDKIDPEEPQGTDPQRKMDSLNSQDPDDPDLAEAVDSSELLDFTVPPLLFEIQVGDEWVPAGDITCR